LSLDILLIMERSYRVDLRHLAPLVWGPEARDNYDRLRQYGATLHQRLTSDQVLEWIDGKTMWNSLLRLGSDVDYSTSDTYDARFMLRLLLSLVEPGMELTCKYFIEQNCLSFAFASLSLSDSNLRGLGYAIIGRFVKRMMELSMEMFDERSLFIYLIKFLRNSMDSANQRLPTVIAHFMARVSKLMLHPEDPVFASIMAYLMLKPVMELNQVPEMFKLLLSSSTEHHHRERNWMLRLIGDSMHSASDYHILEKRHCIKLCLALFPSCMVDLETRKCILALLKTCARHGGTVSWDLVYRHGIFAWIAFMAQQPGTTRWELGYLAEIADTLLGHLSVAKMASDETWSVVLRCSIRIAITDILRRLNAEADKPKLMWSRKLEQASERLFSNEATLDRNDAKK